MIAEFISSMVPKAVVPRIRNATLENPAFSLNDVETWNAIMGGIESDAGIKISHDTSLSLAPVWQAVSIISGDMACMPLNVYKREENGDREIDRKHPAEKLVSRLPNSSTPAFEFWRRIVAHALLWGNGYAWIRRAGRVGTPLEMFHLLPDRTAPQFDDDGKLFYITEVNGQMQSLFADEVLHIKGLSFQPGIGADLVVKARNSWGLALAAEGFNSRFFANGTQAGGILTIHPGFTKTAKDNLEEGFAKRYAGKDNWFKTIVLREGATFQQSMFSAEQTQMHEVREDQVREVARWFALPGFKLGLQDSVSYNSSEQAQLVYLNSTLNHWRCTVVAEASLKLLSKKELDSGSHFLEHNVTKLLEVDSKTLNELLEIQRRNEIINANEWRRKINLNRRDDPGGDEYVNPNTKTKPQPGGGQEPREGEQDDNNPVPSRGTANAHANLLRQAINRMSRRVTFDAKKAAKNPQKFVAWLDSRAHEHRDLFDVAVRPVIEAHATITEIDTDATVCGLNGRFFQELIESLDVITRPPHEISMLTANVDDVCATFTATIADELIPLAIGEVDVTEQDPTD